MYSTDERISSGAVRPSPIFYLIVAITAVSAWLTTTTVVSSGVAVFLFILAAWTLSLIFHEFAHAYVAWRSGDRSIVQRGYLTLDPRRYTHPLLSLVLPVVFIMMGGIALPGGAVMINRGALNNVQATMVALAGPLTNLFFRRRQPGGRGQRSHRPDNPADPGPSRRLLRLPADRGVRSEHPAHPGLDGYAAIEPALPESTQQLMRPVKNYAFLILIFLLFYAEWARDLFWRFVLAVLEPFGVDGFLFQEGLDLFRFWGDLSVF